MSKDNHHAYFSYRFQELVRQYYSTIKKGLTSKCQSLRIIFKTRYKLFPKNLIHNSYHVTDIHRSITVHG